MPTKTKNTLVADLATEIETLKNRMERLRLRGLASPTGRIDRASDTILGHLGKTGPQRLSTVAQYFALDVSTISRHVAELEEHGLITRAADPQDGRAQLLSVTEAGSARYEEVQSKKRGVIGEQLADWSNDDCAKLVELLGRYNVAMEQRFGSSEGTN